MAFHRVATALVAALCGTWILANSAHADDRAYMIATVDLKFEMLDEFRRRLVPCAMAVKESGITLEVYVVDIGNAQKVVDLWGGPSIEAIRKAWAEHSECGFPLGDLVDSETLEAAHMLDLPYGKK